MTQQEIKDRIRNIEFRKVMLENDLSDIAKQKAELYESECDIQDCIDKYNTELEELTSLKNKTNTTAL